MKFNSETKSIAIGTVVGAAIGVALNNIVIGIAIGIVFAVGLINKNKASKEN